MTSRIQVVNLALHLGSKGVRVGVACFAAQRAIAVWGRHMARWIAPGQHEPDHSSDAEADSGVTPLRRRA